MDNEVEYWLKAHCNYLTYGYCYIPACVRIGKREHYRGAVCIPLKIYTLLQQVDDNATSTGEQQEPPTGDTA